MLEVHLISSMTFTFLQRSTLHSNVSATVLFSMPGKDLIFLNTNYVECSVPKTMRTSYYSDPLFSLQRKIRTPRFRTKAGTDIGARESKFMAHCHDKVVSSVSCVYILYASVCKGSCRAY